MNKHEQKRYIKEYAATFVKEMTALITAGKVPEEWDDHELRLWFSIKAADNAKASILRRMPRGKRARDFNNALSATTSRGRCNP